MEHLITHTTFPKDKQRFLFSPTSAVKVNQYLTEWYEGHKHTYSAESALEKQHQHNVQPANTSVWKISNSYRAKMDRH